MSAECAAFLLVAHALIFNWHVLSVHPRKDLISISVWFHRLICLARIYLIQLHLLLWIESVIILRVALGCLIFLVRLFWVVDDLCLIRKCHVILSH